MMYRALIVLLYFSVHAQADDRVALKYRPAPPLNPLKGLVPYSGSRDAKSFPHTMEFSYLSFGDLVRGKDDYHWQPLEDLLNDVASRGHQTVFRIYLEYPGKLGVIPKFLIEDGLKVHKYLNTNTQPEPPQQIETPDYENPALRACLQRFILALGKKYDGDPRIGFITAGLLGTWGEWHTYPKEELFASKTVQNEVMDAYEAAFKKTWILYRYPAGLKDDMYASNHQRRAGYHDDSFAWATLDTGKKKDDWFFMPVLKKAAALDKWKTAPIGGEIRPEAWGKVFDEKPDGKQIQNFRACVEATHASWVMDSGMFNKKANQERRTRAEVEVQRMGYEFHISGVTLTRKNESTVSVTCELENRGVAPFYYDWPLQYRWLDAKGNLSPALPCSGSLTKLLPGDKPRTWTDELTHPTTSGPWKLLLEVPNPLKNGVPLRFANETQDADKPGLLTLLTLQP